jgi:hypothetical protein
MMSGIVCTVTMFLKESLMEASQQQFSCANPEKSEKTQRKIREIMADEDSKLDFERHKSHPFPKALLVSSTYSLVITCFYI